MLDCFCRMLRTPHMKTFVNQLRFHRDGHTVCRRSSGVLRDQRTTPRSRRSASSGVSAVWDTCEHVCPWATRRISASSHFLATRMNFSSIDWAHTPKTFFLFLHSSLNGSPSQYRSKCLLSVSQNSPESSIKRQTCSSDGTGIFQRPANAGSGRSAVLTVQTRGLRRRSASDECLSAGNESRCRRSLQPNAALYEREGRSWAAVLVCLCAVSGRPALLFTLRSAQLKGRHKGDVRCASRPALKLVSSAKRCLE